MRWLRPLQALPQALAMDAILLALHAGSLLFAVPLAAYAVFLWRTGHRLTLTARFPPVDSWLVRPVRVLQGPAARRTSRLLRCLSALRMLAAVAEDGLMLAIAGWITPRQGSARFPF
jgi:hypothetical protein